MTRTGKIARLPLAIRQQLNQRLQDGQKARQIVEWLNSLPEVQAVMAAAFNGKPIEEYNLSRWKSGGYESWEQEQCTREAATAMIEGSPALQKGAKNDIADRLAFVLTARMAVEINRLNHVPEGRRKFQIWRDVVKLFAVLRRGEIQEKRLRLHHEQFDFLRDFNQIERLKARAESAGTESARGLPE
jgi:hypothetical protein